MPDVRKIPFFLHLLIVSRNAYLAALLQADEGEGEMTLEWTNDT